MTQRTFSKTSPDKATELFSRLLKTSDTAVATRERLFVELKEELELLAHLQEQHLYPILLKHRETRDVVQNAMSDNLETGALLSELEHLPKDNVEFINKVANLRRIFQQHIRDDKHELLPAVLKVLSNDEAEAVAEQVEEDMAAGRTEAKRERGQSDLDISRSVGDAVRYGVAEAQNTALETQDLVQSGLATAFGLSRKATDQMLGLFSVRGPEMPTLPTTASHALDIARSTGAVLAKGTHDFSREWFRLTQERVQKNLDALTAIAGSRSLPDLAAAHSSLVRTNLAQTMENSQRLAEISMRIGKDVAGTIVPRASPTEGGRRGA